MVGASCCQFARVHMEWLAFLFGWPGPLLALGLAVAGVTNGRRSWLVVAGVVLVPFAIYLGGSPRFRWLGALPVVPLLGAVAIGRNAYVLAWLSVACSRLVGGTHRARRVSLSVLTS